MADVALITIHGMGKIKPDYFRHLEDGLVDIFGRRQWDRVAFRNVQYAPVLQGPQDELWEAQHERHIFASGSGPRVGFCFCAPCRRRRLLGSRPARRIVPSGFARS